MILLKTKPCILAKNEIAVVIYGQCSRAFVPASQFRMPQVAASGRAQTAANCG